jgi:hypothetical protein
VDWKSQEVEILRHHRALIQIDTSPPSHETKVDDYLKRVLEAEGIPAKTFALDPERANLVARLKGNGTKRPILLMAHTDVVGVQREKWPVEPFGAVIKDGYIWGRGSRDDKDELAANLMVMPLAKRMGLALDRDLIFFAESSVPKFVASTAGVEAASSLASRAIPPESSAQSQILGQWRSSLLFREAPASRLLWAGAGDDLSIWHGDVEWLNLS